MACVSFVLRLASEIETASSNVRHRRPITSWMVFPFVVAPYSARTDYLKHASTFLGTREHQKALTAAKVKTEGGVRFRCRGSAARGVVGA